VTAVAAQPTLPNAAAFAPGVYDIPAEEYHADRTSLSSSGARKLLPPSCPALFKWEQDHGQPTKATFEFGTAAHQMVLGSGPELVVVDRERWDTNAVKAEVAAIREAGAVPLKPSQMAEIKAMAEALRAHPLAAALLDPQYGKPEQSLFWRDPESGVNCRCRLDWLPVSDDGRMLVPEYKSCINASLKAFERSVAEYRYDQQAEWNTDGLRRLGLADDVQFLFIAQEKTAPYLVNVITLSVDWLLMARDRNVRARETYAACLESGRWPGYSDDVVTAGPPAWLEAEHDREYH
jgi:hypothetical protein